MANEIIIKKARQEKSDTIAGYVGDLPISPPINRALLGLLVFLGTEVMFFGGLISTFLILRASSVSWPPPGQPRLPVAETALNTLFLLASGFTMLLAMKAIRQDRKSSSIRWLSATALLGSLFLAIQGSEWLRLVRFGLTFTSSTYGGTFYALIGCHGLHMLAALMVLLLVLIKAVRNAYSAAEHSGLALCSVYWYFVVGIWPVLYLLVYLS